MTQEHPPDSDPPPSFVVPLFAGIFEVLGYVSVLGMARRLIPWMSGRRRAYVIVEAWVIAHTIIAGAGALIAYYAGLSSGVRVLVGYGILRVFEITVYQTNVLLFDEWRAKRKGMPYELRGYRRMVILLLHNYVEVIFWFMTVLIFLQMASHAAVEGNSLVQMFRASLALMVSFSTDSVRPLDLYAAVTLAAQSIIGVFMTVLTLARFMSLLPAPRSLDRAE